MTIAGQQAYDTVGTPVLATVRKIDSVHCYFGGQSFKLHPMQPDEIEQSTLTATGQPSHFVWYGDALYLYPTPGDAYQVRMAGLFSAAAPASDTETGNPWMTKAERLIRSRAKWELALHVVKDQGLATTMAEATREAFDQLVSATNQLTSNGGRVRPMAF